MTQDLGRENRLTVSDIFPNNSDDVKKRLPFKITDSVGTRSRYTKPIPGYRFSHCGIVSLCSTVNFVPLPVLIPIVVVSGTVVIEGHPRNLRHQIPVFIINVKKEGHYGKPSFKVFSQINLR